MAFSIHVVKFADEGEFVVYEYGSTGKQFGKIKIRKDNGDVLIIEPAEGDEREAQAQRAGFALMKHWRQGEFPDKTYWAS
ncbi:hypothetical protein ACJJIR_09670 [Microbulbifer sp. SSSA008]|uniref:hypothetical protein n=1 Tax=Microbulbifer sp. SSSA008 TaxID=3243380 RepID=UPI00403A31FE